MATGDGACKYSCGTASETLEWIHAIIDFLKPYRCFLDAHVVNFFKDRLWEAVDEEWIDCLRKEPLQKILQIPSGAVQNYWPASLKEYVLTLRSLSLLRDQADLQEAFPDLRIAPLNTVISQGMNPKKKHEIEALAAVIGSISKKVGANTIVDVGSGQGYLAQVLSFEHELPVVAVDASSHHGSVTDARAKRIEKYYAAKVSRSETKGFGMPRTVTCQVLSSAMLKDVSNSLVLLNNLENATIFRDQTDGKAMEGNNGNEIPSPLKAKNNSSLILAGLHACGDLSVTMLRAFMECDEVKAVVSIGCCYNLLSEGCSETDIQCGFPMSRGAKSASFHLGKNARDLACQSPERCRALGEAAGIHNLELHAFRAAFQMVLLEYFPEVISKNPAIGRQGKALRRQLNRKILESNAGSTLAENPLLEEPSAYPETLNDESHSIDRYSTFVKFCKSGLSRLGLHDSHHINYYRVWKEAEEFSELVGPYWTLRAALGPVLETLLLLDRLLFLQEQGNALIHAVMVPLFDPILSPRNMALIAQKVMLHEILDWNRGFEQDKSGGKLLNGVVANYGC